MIDRRLSRRIAGAVTRALILATAVLVSAASPATALAGFRRDDTAAQAAAALRSAAVYVDPEAATRGMTADAAGLPADVRVAVLPGDARTAVGAARTILAGLRPSGPLTVGVVAVGADRSLAFRARSTRYCTTLTDDLAGTTLTDHGAELRRHGDLTAMLTDFADRLRRLTPDPSCRSVTTSADAVVRTGPGSSGVLRGVILAVVAVLLAVALGFAVRRWRRSRPGRAGDAAGAWAFADAGTARGTASGSGGGREHEGAFWSSFWGGDSGADGGSDGASGGSDGGGGFDAGGGGD